MNRLTVTAAISVLVVATMLASGCGRIRFDEGNADAAPLPRSAATQVAVGTENVCALVESDIWCWGQPKAVGIAGAVGISEPSKIAEPGPWIHVAVGERTACGIKQSGELWCWGGDLEGGPQRSSSVPLKMGSISDWVDVGVASHGTCAVRGNGELWCWDGFWGPINFTKLQPASNWIEVGAQEDTFCAKNNVDEIWCGEFLAGVDNALVLALRGSKRFAVSTGQVCSVTQEGSVECFNTREMKRITMPGSDWRHVAIISLEICATTVDRELHCFDRNLQGAATVHLAEIGWEALSSDGKVLCGVDGGDVRCKGAATDGLLGDGTFRWGGLSEMSSAIRSIGSSYSGGCWSDSNGAARCWGYSQSPLIGAGSQRYDLVPVVVPGNWQSFSTAAARSCGIDGGVTKCWNQQNLAPVVGTYRQVEVDDRSVCALTPLDQLTCWGRNLTNGADGDDTPIDTAPGIAFSSIELQAESACGLEKNTGRLLCWGKELVAEDMQSTTSMFRTVRDIAPGQTFSAMSVYNGNGCAIGSDKSLRCWGSALTGSLGRPSATLTTTPVLVDAATDWKSVAVSAGAACATKQDATLWCWGSARSASWMANVHVSLPSVTPIQIGEGRAWATVISTLSGFCATTVDDKTFCYGADTRGNGSSWSESFVTTALPKK
jgi:hypothetical protein